MRKGSRKQVTYEYKGEKLYSKVGLALLLGCHPSCINDDALERVDTDNGIWFRIRSGWVLGTVMALRRRDEMEEEVKADVEDKEAKMEVADEENKTR